jgi:arabinogalactan oligomer/maltooligosaccharide transport system substrate-binding protein
MRRKLYVSLGLIAALTVILSLAACGGGGDQQAAEAEYTGPAEELVVWHAYRGGEKDAFEAVVADFNASQKRYSATTLAVPYDAYADKITAAVPRGKGPDVFIFAQDRLGGWAESGGTLEPLDFFLDDEVRGRFLPLTLDAMTYRDTIYGLPLNYKAVTLMYNKALVPEPPTDTAQLVEMARKLTDAKAGRYGLAYFYNDFYYHSALMNAFGGGVFDAERNPIIDSEANVDSVKLMMRWFKQDGILPAEPSTALITALFNEGRAAMIFNGPWFLGEISPEVDYGLALLPAVVEAGGTPMKPWVTVEGVYVAAPSQNKEAAYDFARYLTSLPAARVLALEGRQTPSNLAIYDDAEITSDPILTAFRAQLENAVPMPNVPEMSLAWSPLTTAMNAVVNGSAGPEAALAEAQQKVAEGIDRMRTGS